MEFHHIVPQDGDMDGELEKDEDSPATPDPPIWSEVIEFLLLPIWVPWPMHHYYFCPFLFLSISLSRYKNHAKKLYFSFFISLFGEMKTAITEFRCFKLTDHALFLQSTQAYDSSPC